MLLVGAVGRVERQELLLAVGADAVADDVGDLVDLEVERPRPVGDDVILVRAVADVDAVGALVEQVDRRRAEQREIRRVDDALERRLAAAEQKHELELVAVDALEARARARSARRSGSAAETRNTPAAAGSPETTAASPAAAPRRRRSRPAGSTPPAGTRATASRLCPAAPATPSAASPGTARRACWPRRRARSGRSSSRSIAVCANFSPAVVFSRIRTPPLMRCATGSALSGRSGANEK